MKLASLRSQSRDGVPVLVSRDLTRAVRIDDLVPSIQYLLDNWDDAVSMVSARSDQLNAGDISEVIDFWPSLAAAPLPRAYQWCDGSAYLSHAELVRKARKAEMPEFLYHDPLMYQGASDKFLGAHDDIEIASEEWGIDLEAEVAVITGDVPMGVTPVESAAAIRLVMIVNDVSLRNLIPHELSKGFGFLQSKPSTAFSPVAVTPDELGSHWDGTRLSLPLISTVNGVRLGNPNAGVDLNFDFPTLISHAARTRHLSAGTVIGSGTVSNRSREAGSSCIAEKRMLEVIDTGEASTPYLSFGDSVEIEMLDERGQSIFGKISQTVVPYQI